MSAVVPFSFEGAAVRIISRESGPWFVLADVCRVLGISNPSDAASRLDDDEKDTLGLTEGIFDARAQALTIISESGLYSLVMTSRKAAARRFRKWVTAEVIPSIRRTGAYGVVDPMTALNDPAVMRGILLNYADKVLSLQADKAALAPKAEALDRIATASAGSMSITAAAKALQRRRDELTGFMLRERWVYRPGGAGRLLPYQPRINAGLLETKVTTVRTEDGRERVCPQALVTPKGLAKLAELLGAGDRAEGGRWDG